MTGDTAGATRPRRVAPARELAAWRAVAHRRWGWIAHLAGLWSTRTRTDAVARALYARTAFAADSVSDEVWDSLTPDERDQWRERADPIIDLVIADSPRPHLGGPGPDGTYTIALTAGQIIDLREWADNDSPAAHALDTQARLHGIGPFTIRCHECGAEFTATDLIDAHNAIVRDLGIDNPSRTARAVRDVHCCPRCFHDF